jgi:GNAT superfamily N-acetyltransferase
MQAETLVLGQSRLPRLNFRHRRALQIEDEPSIDRSSGRNVAESEAFSSDVGLAREMRFKHAENLDHSDPSLLDLGRIAPSLGQTYQLHDKRMKERLDPPVGPGHPLHGSRKLLCIPRQEVRRVSQCQPHQNGVRFPEDKAVVFNGWHSTVWVHGTIGWCIDDSKWPYHAYRRLRAHEEDPDEPLVTDETRQRDMQTDWPLFWTQIFLAKVEKDIAGSLLIWMRRPGTADYQAHARYVTTDIGVRKAMRRHGVGTALLGQLAHVMHDGQREIATFSTQTNDGHAFALAIGAEEKHRAMQNRLDIRRVDRGMLAGWEQRGETAGMVFEVHAGRVPLDRYETIIPALTVMLNSDPLGELDLPPRRFDLTAIKAWYANMDKHGGDHVMVLLRQGETIAAMSEANWVPDFPERAFQNLTAVDPAYRGRGLAKAAKARLLRVLLERHPQLRLVITNNADVNAAMLAVNRQHRDVAP